MCGVLESVIFWANENEPLLQVTLAVLGVFIACNQLRLEHKVHFRETKKQKGYFLLSETNIPSNKETIRHNKNRYDLANPIPFFVSGNDDIYLCKTKIKVNNFFIKTSICTKNICYSSDPRFNRLELEFILPAELKNCSSLEFNVVFWLKNTFGYKYKQTIAMNWNNCGKYWELNRYNFWFSRFQWHLLWHVPSIKSVVKFFFKKHFPSFETCSSMNTLNSNDIVLSDEKTLIEDPKQSLFNTIFAAIIAADKEINKPVHIKKERFNLLCFLEKIFIIIFKPQKIPNAENTPIKLLQVIISICFSILSFVCLLIDLAIFFALINSVLYCFGLNLPSINSFSFFSFGINLIYFVCVFLFRRVFQLVGRAFDTYQYSPSYIVGYAAVVFAFFSFIKEYVLPGLEYIYSNLF